MKPMRRTLRPFAIIAVLSFGAAAFAHEFWIDPRPPAALESNVELTAWSGMEFRGENRKVLSPEKLRSLRAFDALGQRDLLESMAQDLETRSVKTRVAGPLFVALYSKRSFLELDAAKFNEYLKEEGLDAVLEARKTNKEDGEPGLELYQRCAKMMMRVLDRDSAKKETKDSSFILKPVGLPIELIPDRDFTNTPPGTNVSVQVLYQNAPLRNALAHIFRRDSSGAASRPAPLTPRTDDNGNIAFTLSSAGEWLVSCVHMVAASNTTDPDHPEAKWESFWGSLSWSTDGAAAAASRPAEK